MNFFEIKSDRVGWLDRIITVYVEALQALDKKTPIKDLSLEQLRTDLNKQLLTGTYDTPIGLISFSPTGEVNQKDFYVAEMKVDKDGNNGQFAYLK